MNNSITNSIAQIESAKALLKSEGYYVDNLWSIDDIQGLYDCSDSEAYDILDAVFSQSEAVHTAIAEAIDEITLDKQIKAH